MEGSRHGGSRCCCEQEPERRAHGHHHHGAWSRTPHGAEGCCGGHDEAEGCCGHHEQGWRLRRRFRSRDERLARLEEYRKDLQEELKAVEERIAQIQAGA